MHTVLPISRFWMVSLVHMIGWLLYGNHRAPKVGNMFSISEFYSDDPPLDSLSLCTMNQECATNSRALKGDVATRSSAPFPISHEFLSRPGLFKVVIPKSIKKHWTLPVKRLSKPCLLWSWSFGRYVHQRSRLFCCKCRGLSTIIDL